MVLAERARFSDVLRVERLPGGFPSPPVSPAAADAPGKCVPALCPVTPHSASIVGGTRVLFQSSGFHGRSHCLLT